MRYFVVVLIFLLAQIAHADEPLKLVSWNLEWFPGGSPGASAEAAAEKMAVAQNAIRVINPDILCLQEVRDWSAANELVSVLPGYHVAICSAFQGKQQQVIATRLPVDSAWAAEWQSRGRLELPRGYAFAAIPLPGGPTLLVYSLHMKANSGGADADNIGKREASAAQLLAHAQAMEKLYGARGPVAVLMAGDWNTTLDSDSRFRREKTLRLLMAGGYRSTWEGVPFEKRITHPGEGNFPPITFDHILLKGPKLTATVIEEKGISDHNPVRLDLMPTGGGAAIAAATPVPTPSPTPVPPGKTEDGQVGEFKVNDPHMVGYSEIPGMPKTTPPPVQKPEPIATPNVLEPPVPED
jgi:endonuclease/exonuclease/phosphatase family metal-dependent hydrolase